MKKLKINCFYLVVLLLILVSCAKKPGTKEYLSDENSSIEVYKYWLNDGTFVYVSKFKTQPNIVTTTWGEQEGKITTTKANVVIYENDSIIIYNKKPNGK